jgi:hypothetical protein
MSKGMYTYEVIILLCFSTALVNTLTRSVCHYNGVSSKKPIEPELIMQQTQPTSTRAMRTLQYLKN